MEIFKSIGTSLHTYFSQHYAVQLNQSELIFQETRKEFEGEITLVCFGLAKIAKSAPQQIAQTIGNYLLETNKELIAFNVVNGFLNLSISTEYLISEWNKSLTHPINTCPKNGKRVMVEYSSPNTNKPLHLGHIRNNVLGYSIAQILQAAGYEVVKANLINDRGIHICKSMLAWQLFGNGELPETKGLKGDHLVGKYYVAFDKAYRAQVQELINTGLDKEQAEKQAPLMKQAQEMLLKWEEKDPEVMALWEMMNNWVYAGFNLTYKRLGVEFDKFYYESNTYLLGKDIVNEGLSKNVFTKKSDGSVWIDLTGDGLDEKLLLRSDGTSVYMTQDVGTAVLKAQDFSLDESIYVVGNEQDYHFKVLFLILQKLGYSWAKGLYHLSYGMVDLPSGKMKSREGTVVDADDLMEEMVATAKENTDALGKTQDFSQEQLSELYETIGIGALKYYLLKVDPKKRLLFDPKESIDLQGHTAPFIQYTYARIQSILKQANSNLNLVEVKEVHASEKDLILFLEKYSSKIKESAEHFNPALLANYLYDLAKTFNKFYQELKEADASKQQFRINLAIRTAETIKDGMSLLGIQVPSKM
jgi:arginyl-tRNA synthetase